MSRRASISDAASLYWYTLNKNRLSLAGIVIIVVVFMAALLASVISPYPADAGYMTHFANALQPPSAAHLFGTDEAGRDIFTRVIFGARTALEAGFIIIVIAIGIGVSLGLIAGYLGGLVDTIIMRITDIFLSIPGLALALLAAAILTPSLLSSSLAISFVWWPWYVRLVRGEVLFLREEQFVQAAEVSGAGKFWIITREVFPNVLPAVVVKGSLDMGYAILWTVALSYLGLGSQPPVADWGAMLAEGHLLLPNDWWLSTFPGLAIFVTVLGFNLLGDGLRDLLDVRKM